MTWTSETPPDPVRIGVAGYALAVLRGVPLALWVFGMLAIHMLVRLIERPIHGARRPLSPWITVVVCRGALVIMGLRREVSGPRMTGPGALVANHSSWLDIFVLNADAPLYFVSKAEVAGWPGIGLLARATGTLFIRRDRREAAAQTVLIQDRLALGHRLLFFPEGTSTDNMRVLPFKTTLFSAFFGAVPGLQVQPLTVAYHPPTGAPAHYYGWWGEMDFGPNLLKVLSTRPQGRVQVVRHPPQTVAEVGDRKALAQRCEAAVRAGFISAKPKENRHQP